MKATHYTKETINSLGVVDRGFPDFRPGDTVRVTLKVVEGEKERLQDFQGVVLSMRGAGISKTFRVRKLSEGVAVERILPYYAPTVVKIVKVSEGIVRRAKLYYVRKKKGRDAVVKQKISH